MRHEALIRFAPIFTRDRFNDAAWRPDRTMYEPGALRFAPGQTSVPLLVDHDFERQIGVVHRLEKIDWTDGPWIYATATVEDRPGWLERGTRASFGSKTLHRHEINIRDVRADIITSALVTEISLLSPNVEPREPCAQVMRIARTDDNHHAGAVIHGGQILRRPNTGRVLGIH